jgi:hypothetical protein
MRLGDEDGRGFVSPVHDIDDTNLARVAITLVAISVGAGFFNRVGLSPIAIDLTAAVVADLVAAVDRCESRAALFHCADIAIVHWARFDGGVHDSIRSSFSAAAEAMNALRLNPRRLAALSIRRIISGVSRTIVGFLFSPPSSLVSRPALDINSSALRSTVADRNRFGFLTMAIR